MNLPRNLRGAGIASEPRTAGRPVTPQPTKGSDLATAAPAPRKTIDGIDDSDQPIHTRIEGTMLAYCGVSLNTNAGYIPEAEVTPTAWCEACEQSWGIS